MQKLPDHLVGQDFPVSQSTKGGVATQTWDLTGQVLANLSGARRHKEDGNRSWQGSTLRGTYRNIRRSLRERAAPSPGAASAEAGVMLCGEEGS